MTGEGGDLILQVAEKVLKEEFPEVAERIRFHIPRAGKAPRPGHRAASLPAIRVKETNHAVS